MRLRTILKYGLWVKLCFCQRNIKARFFPAFLLYFCLTLAQSGVSLSDAATVGRIDITGLNSVGREEMLDMLGFTEGASIDAEIIKLAIKRAFRKGIFDDIAVNVSDTVPSVVTVQVFEKDMIRRVSVQGTYPLSARKVRELLMLKEGDVMRYDLIDQAAAGLREYFAELGYPDAKISIGTLQDEKQLHTITVIVSIEAGQALVIEGISVAGTDVVKSEDIGLSAGDIYDQIKLRKELLRIRGRLKKEGYFKPVTGSYSFKEGILTVQIDPGRRLLTEIDGNSAISTKRLEKEMPFFDAEVFNDEAVDEAVNRMLSLYHAEGYSAVQIAPVIYADQRQVQVYFFVYEGRQVKIRKISFTGAALAPKILRSVLELKEGAPYDPDMIQRDRDTLREYYAALGYLEAAVGEIEVRTDEVSGDLDLIFPIKEGMITILETIQVNGVEEFTRDEIFALILLREGQPYNEVEISDARFRIIDHYSRKGFASINVTVERTIKEHRAWVVFTIAEGSRMTIGRIVVAGNKRTKYRVIKREIEPDTGSPYSFHLLGQGRQKLYKLGLFTDVDIESSDADDNRKDLLIRVQEGNAGFFEFGLGFAEYERFRGFMEVGYRNLFGMNRQGQLRAEVSSLERRFILQYHEPWFIEKSLPLRIIFIQEQKKELTIPSRIVRYELERYTLNAGIEKKLTEKIKGEAYYEFSLVRTWNVKPDVVLSREDVGSLAISSVRASLVYDSRDNPFEPKSGLLAGLTVKVASPILLSETHFAKATASASFFHQLHKRVVLGLFASGGVAYGFGDTTEIPIVERYFLGGRSSVRGYEQDMLGPKGSDGNATGGNVFFMGSMELRTDIGKNIGIVSFFDFGNVWISTREFAFSGIKYTAGLGLRYATPVGPLRVDYGYKLRWDDTCADRTSQPLQCSPEGRGAIHFSIGHAF